LVGVTVILGVRQFWVFVGHFIDFKIFVLFFVLNFFLLNDKIFKDLYYINGNSKCTIKSYL
jgi:hypothetical protein